MHGLWGYLLEISPDYTACQLCDSRPACLCAQSSVYETGLVPISWAWIILQLFLLIQMVLKTKRVCVCVTQWLKIKSKLTIWIVIYFAAEILICSQNANATADHWSYYRIHNISILHSKIWIHKHIWPQSIWIGLYVLIYVKCREWLLNVADNINMLLGWERFKYYRKPS